MGELPTFSRGPLHTPDLKSFDTGLGVLQGRVGLNILAVWMNFELSSNLRQAAKAPVVQLPLPQRVANRTPVDLSLTVG